jgi:branched-chain amino acid transport system permease protein
MAIAKNRIFRMGVGLAATFVAAFIPLLPALHNLSYALDAAYAVMFALTILSVVILTGYVGQVSLCQGTFMGVSAFATGWLYNAGFNYLLAALCGVIIAFALGVLVGIPALRLRGILLAIVTVGVALSFDYFFFQDQSFGWFNGGLSGWKVDQIEILGQQLDGFSVDHLLKLYWVLLAVFAIVAVLVINLHDSGSGRRFRAIRDSELAAATMGVDLTRYKLLAFGLAAAVAGIGGAFWPVVVGAVTYQPFSFFYSLQFAAFAVLMGIRFVPSAALAGLFLVVVPEFLTRFVSPKVGDILKIPDFQISYNYFSVALGLLLVVQLITAPDGVYGDLAKLGSRLFGGGHAGTRPVAEKVTSVTR